MLSQIYLLKNSLVSAYQEKSALSEFNHKCTGGLAGDQPPSHNTC